MYLYQLECVNTFYFIFSDHKTVILLFIFRFDLF